MNLRDSLRLLAHIQLLPILENGEETTLIGGQAVIEGVMMRSPSSYCVAVRTPTGEIVTTSQPLSPAKNRHAVLRWPVLRGLVTLGSAMTLGTRALKFSAECAAGEAGGKSAIPENQKSAKADGGKTAMAFQIAFSLLFMITLYKFVPLYLATTLGHHFDLLSGRLAVNLVDGTLRIGIFLGFMYLLSRMSEMYRLFQYHGAEHKAVFNFESGQSINVENAQRFQTWHPRCGTSFLVVVLIVSMAAYAFLPIDNFWAKLAARIALLPVIVGLSYETIRYAAQRRNGFLAVLTAPGLWLQRVTTKPPTDDQMEVSICALNEAMDMERARGGTFVIA